MYTNVLTVAGLKTCALCSDAILQAYLDFSQLKKLLEVELLVWQTAININQCSARFGMVNVSSSARQDLNIWDESTGDLRLIMDIVESEPLPHVASPAAEL